MDTISQSKCDDSDDSDDNNNCLGHIQCSAESFASVSVDLTDDPALKHETGCKNKRQAKDVGNEPLKG